MGTIRGGGDPRTNTWRQPDQQEGNQPHATDYVARPAVCRATYISDSRAEVSHV